jgi:hypothetical protein
MPPGRRRSPWRCCGGRFMKGAIFLTYQFFSIMSAATTKLANLALSHIGARPLVELDEDTTTEAKSCRLHYDAVMEALLRMHQWNFATRRAEVVFDSVPANEWASAWKLPTDCVRLIRVCGASPESYVDHFAIEGRKLLLDVPVVKRCHGSAPPSGGTCGCHPYPVWSEPCCGCSCPPAEVPGTSEVELVPAEKVYVVYISSESEPADYDPIFRRAFTYLLAAEIAQDITQNANLAQSMMQQFRKLDFQDAIKVDAREVASGENYGPRAMIARSPLVAARFGRSI